MNDRSQSDASDYPVTGQQPQNENGQTLLMLLGIACLLVAAGTGLNWLFG
ncbi:hypothetical protein [Bordetella genomosp. 13]|nr:hypothetical protein [Bordetella genomosp. 13]